MKITRLIGILSILLQKQRATAADLAKHFEVSPRTIYRDVETLCQAGIPLASTQGIGGGISIMDGYKIDKTLLTSHELQAVLIGLKSLDSVSGTNRYQQLMAKLCPPGSDLLAVDQHILIDLASWDKVAMSRKIEMLHSAIFTSQLVSFNYCAPSGETQRQVEPYKLVFQWSGWYLWGWCRLRQDFRLFKLGRMSDLTLGDEFEPRNVPMPDLSNENVFPTKYQVKALIQPDYKWRLIDDYGVESFQEQPDGRLLFEFGFSDEDNLISWLASFGDKAELLEPVELRQRMLEFAQEICQIYY